MSGLLLAHPAEEALARSGADAVEAGSFDDRFSPLSTPESPAGDLALQPLDRSALAAVELKFRVARGMLALQLMSRDWRTAFVDQVRP